MQIEEWVLSEVCGEEESGEETLTRSGESYQVLHLSQWKDFQPKLMFVVMK